MEQVKASIVRVGTEEEEKSESGIIKILKEDKTIPEDIVIESLKQYLSYNLVRILSPVVVTGVDIFKISNEFFDRLDIMKYLTSKNKNVQSLFANMIFGEVGKVISTTEIIKQTAFSDDVIEKIKNEIDDAVRSCINAVKK